MSNPFFYKDGRPLNTESNNSFYLKYRLTTALPGIQFEFQNIDQNLENLKKCVKSPIRFLYIGSDYYNEEGNLFCEDKELRSSLIENKVIKEIINDSQINESCEILILGMTNCDNEKDSLLSFFIEKKFRHIIYMNYAQIKQLLKNDEKKDEKKEEVFDLYFYFQKMLFYFY
jgi:hypothetical protein